MATAGALALKCATDPRPTLDRTDRSHTKITISTFEQRAPPGAGVKDLRPRRGRPCRVDP
jgi:hypothetical protein